MVYNSFEEMPVLKNAMEIAEHVFQLTISLPKSEDYGLTSQIRRASLSISANIAEGFGRSTNLDKRKFYIIARGSAFETKSHLIYGKRVHYFNEEDVNNLNQKIESNLFELNKLIKFLSSQPQPQPQP